MNRVLGTALLAAGPVVAGHAAPGRTAIGPVRRPRFPGWPAWAAPATWRERAPGATPGSVRATLTRSLGGGGVVLLPDSSCTSPPGAASAALGALPWLFGECGRHGLSAGPLAGHG